MTSKTPCAFAAGELVIPAGGNITITTLYGRVPNEALYETDVYPKVATHGYVDEKYKQNNDMMERLTNKVTSLPTLVDYHTHTHKH